MYFKYNSFVLWFCCMGIKIYGIVEMNSIWYFGKIFCKKKFIVKYENVSMGI